MERSEFGRTVRRWRERVAPGAVGLPTGGRRRAAGLRREELAGLAGISTDYLTRLEQGRATSPSLPVVEALARGLRVSDTERTEQVFADKGQGGGDGSSSRLAGRHPTPMGSPVTRGVPPRCFGVGTPLLMGEPI